MISFCIDGRHSLPSTSFGRLVAPTFFDPFQQQFEYLPRTFRIILFQQRQFRVASLFLSLSTFERRLINPLLTTNKNEENMMKKRVRLFSFVSIWPINVECDTRHNAKSIVINFTCIRLCLLITTLSFPFPLKSGTCE